MVAGVGRQPEHQLVEEQDETVVPELLGMAGEDREAIIDADVFGEHVLRGTVVLAEPCHQCHVLDRCRSGKGGGFKPLGRPLGIECAPAGLGTLRVVEFLEEQLVAVIVAFHARLSDQRRRFVDRREVNTRLRAGEEIDVALEDAVFQRTRPDHVIGHEQELLFIHPAVVPLDHLAQFGDGPCLGLTFEDEMQHGHEMTLTRTEAAVEIGAVAGTVLQRVADDIERTVEAAHELVGDDVFLERCFGVEDAFGQPQHETVCRERLGDVDQFAEQCHGAIVLIRAGIAQSGDRRLGKPRATIDLAAVEEIEAIPVASSYGRKDCAVFVDVKPASLVTAKIGHRLCGASNGPVVAKHLRELNFASHVWPHCRRVTVGKRRRFVVDVAATGREHVRNPRPWPMPLLTRPERAAIPVDGPRRERLAFEVEHEVLVRPSSVVILRRVATFYRHKNVPELVDVEGTSGLVGDGLFDLVDE